MHCIAIGIDKLIEPLKTTIYFKVKANSVKQEYEKQEELKRSALRAVSALSCIPDSGTYVDIIMDGKFDRKFNRTV